MTPVDCLRSVKYLYIFYYERGRRPSEFIVNKRIFFQIERSGPTRPGPPVTLRSLGESGVGCITFYSDGIFSLRMAGRAVAPTPM